ncbi:ATP-binding protein [SAR202 cluster bacterium AD-804-J14_MRT_500m]|nr:ATP-binding protein [SAR202 cluster bacterium AD-804-J14_MRT_500m]
MTFDNESFLGPQGELIGMVIDGSLSRGAQVRLGSGISIEDIKEGTYITIQGQRYQFFGIITDVFLSAVDNSIQYSLPDVSSPFISQVVADTLTFGSITVLPMLTLPAILGDDSKPEPAKTIPAHFSNTFRASDRDVELVFGEEDENHFFIGNPLDMETKVCLNIEELVKRSSGIFGKSGTGKTFLTRLLLVGILQSDAASSLIFDMHNEYGWAGQDSDRNQSVKGLRTLFGSTKVAVASLDPESSDRRGNSPDFDVQIGYDEINPSDIQLLKDTLNLSEVAASAAYDLERKLGDKQWLSKFLELEDTDEIYNLAAETNIQPNALRALHNRLSRLKRFKFMVPKAPVDSVQEILNLLEAGKHVVLEFGRYGNDLNAYILVANLLTSRIHQRYVYNTEAAENDPSGTTKPRPLIICIEEAHRFLNPSIASQTIFGTIARELRKYSVTLMVIDQRPSAIDPEVMSQIGTKVACLLDNERDVDATLSGVHGARELRSVLSRLDAKQQALIFGHGVPMPVVVRTREYGASGNYEDLTNPHWKRSIGTNGAQTPADRDLDQELKDLF